MYYPFFVDGDLSVRLPSVKYDELRQEYNILDAKSPEEKIVYPIKDDGSEGCWYFGYDRAKLVKDEFKAELTDKGDVRVYYRRRPNNGVQPTSLWFDSKYSATEHGTALLKKLFGEQDVFSYPKSIYAVEDCLSVCGVKDNQSIVLDYFAGSGTTAHAVINFNRQDNISRKYILVEQGAYFDDVLKPRIQKVVYSPEWFDGSPTLAKNGISHAVKVLKIESYEDTLNNLQLQRTAVQGDLLSALEPETQEDYLVNYMLDVESRGSLLSVNDFKKPFDYEMNIAVDSAGAYERQKIDLVETFNYLIGLTVKTIDAHPERGFTTVTGILPSGESCLVLWRDCDLLDYDGITKLCDTLHINPADNEFDVVYINGDHNIPTVLTKTADEGSGTRVLKLRQIEPEFLERMFSEDNV